MRAFYAIGAASLMAYAIPAASRADAPGPGAAMEIAKPDCKCPQIRRHIQHRHVRQVMRYRRHHVLAAEALVPIVPLYYNPALPGPHDSGYDRAMVLHFRSPPVSGLYRPEPGYPPTPPVRGVHYYRVQPGPVFQYDGLTGEYIQLARNDQAYVETVAAVPLPPAPVRALPPQPVPRGERG